LFKDQLVYFLQKLSSVTLYFALLGLAWPGVEGTAEFFTLSLERSQQMLRVMLHKGNSYKFVSLFQQYIFDEINFCKNIFFVNTDQAETFQAVKNLVAQHRLQIYMTDRVTNVTERK
jgi:hypothetical protein